jgi:cytochrome c1
MLPKPMEEATVPGGGMKPGSTEPGAPSPDQIKQQLVGVVKQLKQVAQANGVDWQEVVSSAEAGAPRAPTGPGMGAAGPVPSPRPPMGSDMGGGMGL